MSAFAAVRDLLIRDDADGAGDAAFADAAAKDLTSDRLFHLLRCERRRHVIRLLDDAGTQSLDALSREIAARETGKTPATVTNMERKRVYVALYQHHLRELADAGVIEYDDRGGVAHPQPPLGVLARIVDDVALLTTGGGDDA